MAGGINIANLFATIGADTKGLESGLGKAKGSLESFGGGLAKQIVGVASFSAAVAAAGKFVADSVSEWAEYSEEMYHASVLTGTTTEEMSRLVQAADDFRVSQDTLTSAMGMALKNGFVPTIENIANLSDELLKISDPAERAAAATKIFGRQWEGVMPLLAQGGDVIREATAGISDSLVVTQEASEEAMAYAAQIDNLNDAWLGIKMSAGKVVLPIVLEMVSNLADNLDGGGDSISKLNEAHKAGVITNELYYQTLDDIANGFITEAGVLALVNPPLKKHNEQIIASEEAYYSMGMTAEEAINAVTKSTSLVTEATYDWVNADIILGNEFVNNDSNMNRLVMNTERVTAAYREQKKTLSEDLSEAYIKLNVEVTTFRETVAGKLADAVENSTLSIKDQLKAFGEIDKVFGTSYKLTMEMDLALDDITKKFLEDPTSLAKLYAPFEDAFLPLQQSVAAAQADVDTLKGKLDDLEREYNITMNIIVNGELPTIPDSWSRSVGTGIEARASGGPVSANTPYLVGESGYEVFVPDSNGSIIPNGQTTGMLAGGNNAALIDAISRIPTAKDIARAVRDAVLMAAG